jgi:catechol 2,3-dioxygenase-like lactoylglutathione lyase family enzyme
MTSTKERTTITKDDFAISFAAARLSLTAAALFLVLLAILHVIKPEFDPSWRFISEYSIGNCGANLLRLVDDRSLAGDESSAVNDRGDGREEKNMTENDQTNNTAGPDMKLELVPVPVSDIDRAKAFYVEKIGFKADHDVQPGNGMRVLQLTPPGSACSIVIGAGLGEMSEIKPGSIKGLHLVVANIVEARAALVGRGVEVGEVKDMGGILFARFADPDGNSWLLQEIPATFKRSSDM